MVAEAGFTALAVAQGSDYGIDIPVTTFDQGGVQESGYLLLQIRGSQRISIRPDRTVAAQIKMKHLVQWANEPWPVILVRYDIGAKRGYWLYVQQYLQRTATCLDSRRDSLTLKIPSEQIISSTSFSHFARCKRRIILQLNGIIDHG